MILAAMEITATGDNQNIAAVVVDDCVSVGVRPNLLGRAPGFSAVVTSTDQPATSTERQDRSILRDNDLRDTLRLEQFLHFEDGLLCRFICRRGSR